MFVCGVCVRVRMCLGVNGCVKGCSSDRIIGQHHGVCVAFVVLLVSLSKTPKTGSTYRPMRVCVRVCAFVCVCVHVCIGIYVWVVCESAACDCM